MKNKLTYGLATVLFMLMVLVGCSDEEYSLGELTPPSNIVINTELVGQDADNPNGDGSGEVIISASADNAMSYKIDFGTSSDVNLIKLNGAVTKKYTSPGDNDYTITVVAYGAGGTSSNTTKQITVNSLFNPDPKIVSDLTGNSSKTWVIQKEVQGHFGVGPYDGSGSPDWYTAGPNEKADCCGCFYSATFTFSQTDSGFTLNTSTPNGAFTKTGDLTTLPGIPGSGDEGCYEYADASSSFSFLQASSGLPTSTPSTQTSIELAGNATFIGYGAVLKEYEILEITEDILYLRVQGTETGNAWYLRLVLAP
ncbi:hypothetical protein JM83_1086 [Gillisia sp. Hel_I_86]|uniref:PKD domain-containing protein n=1 Tax=Gillisia sp. Hel_I_86 TaxID=1249981 RepID=UPI00119A2D19|nr:PKD domain-containing protein [Gillisia sp. Hel_I_86]TVZ26136.1 hypothetical protein JM83_1086 [Gillisia sp. Hel_I_86]